MVYKILNEGDISQSWCNNILTFDELKVYSIRTFNNALYTNKLLILNF